MVKLLIGLIVFIGIHSISIFALAFRNRMAETNQLLWKGSYSLISLIGLVLLIQGYGEYRLTAEVLYVTPLWLRHVSALLLVPFFILMLAPYFPSALNNKLKHPQLVAVKLWAVAHLLVNGSMADLILFGSFLAWAIADRISVKRRPVREVPHIPESRLNMIISIVGGLMLYVIFAIWLHGPLIGVRPFG
ncbi:MAG: NnrU family protein [Gammaproteobacteria bacterium]|nr:NnrU family protein [Gammaproteobacteria bacterium]